MITARSRLLVPRVRDQEQETVAGCPPPRSPQEQAGNNVPGLIYLVGWVVTGRVPPPKSEIARVVTQSH